MSKIDTTTKQQIPKTKTQSDKNNPKEQTAKQAVKPLLSIIHFNDVYDIQPKGGSMGVCHFKAKLDQLKKNYPQSLVLFSGDCFSPSTLTNIKQGWQMVHALNTLGIDCACYGNHEFDFQEQHSLKLAKACKFPWLLANIRHISTQRTLGDGIPYITKQVGGLKVGIMGIAGEDWVGILSDDYQGLLEYQDCYATANRLAVVLREKEKCDIVIALTHMRNWADLQFPKKVKGVDLVLGGHDHVILQQIVQGTAVIKSGSNFNNIGQIHLYPLTYVTSKPGNSFNYEWNIHKIQKAQIVDIQLQKYVDEIMVEYQKYDQIVGHTDVELQTRFTQIRTRQTNYGNFLADLIRKYYDCDIAFINAGMVRNDSLIPAGKLTYSKISNIIDSPMIVKSLPGSNILKTLQYSVSQYPGYAGQFLFVSGIRFAFDPTKNPRVQWVKIDQNDLVLQKEYSVATTAYQAKGGDGFVDLKGGKMIIDEVKSTAMLHCILKFFKAADSHQQYTSIKSLSSQLQKQEGENTANGLLPTYPQEQLTLTRKISVRIGRIKELRSRYVMNTDGMKLTSIEPKEENRIQCLNPLKK